MECRHALSERKPKQKESLIGVENSIEKRRRSIKQQENVYYQMTNKMSAAGKLGSYKYENPE